MKYSKSFLTFRFYFFNVSATILFLISGCKCDDPSDPNCPNFDPCLCINEDFADFKMEERILLYENPQYIETLHTTENNTIYFSILDESVDSVHWQIGTDPRIRKETNFDVFFDSPFGEITIRCIAFKKSVADCLGESFSSDTTIKTLTVHNWYDVPYFGTYQGKSTNSSNAFNTTIDSLTYFTGFGIHNQRSPITFLENFPKDYQMTIPPDGINIPNRPSSRFFYNGFTLVDAGKLTNLVAIFNPKSQQLNIEYYFQENSSWERHQYIGEKIN